MKKCLCRAVQKAGCPLLFVLVLCFFYPELIGVRSAPLVGDHWEQHYPWARLLWEGVRSGHLPWWTSSIHSGFPLAAESQIGVFYLPNLILSRLLPFNAAYAYQSVIHFLLSGLGTYFYARQLGMIKTASLFASLIFVYGAGYGGAYYNITSLKTLAWFPWMLFLFEKFLASGKKRFLVLLSAVLGQCLVAGYLQVALFTMAFFSCYGFLRILFFSPEIQEDRPNAFARLVLFLASLVLGLAAAAPQLLLTYPLAMISNRTQLSEDYAYVGSMSPFAAGTFFFPHLQTLFRGNCLYSGVVTVYAVILSFTLSVRRKPPELKLWICLTAIAFLLALGRWSPLYVALVKVTHFYSFRIPAKFLIFIHFGVAFIAAFGLQSALKLLKQEGSEAFKKYLQAANRNFAVLAAGAAGLFISASLILSFFSPVIEKVGEAFVKTLILGKAGHPHSAEVYQEKLHSYLEGMRSALAFDERGCLGAFAWLLLFYLVLRILERIRFRRTVFTALLGGLLLGDLYVYSYYDMRTDFDTYAHALRKNPAAEAIVQDHRQGIHGRLYVFRTPSEMLPLIPTVNSLYGIDDIGAYSPLVSSRYNETIGQLGNVNDSNLAATPSREFVLERMPLLDALGVSHILAAGPLQDPRLEEMLRGQEGSQQFFLYRNRSFSSGAFYVENLEMAENWEALKTRFMSPGFDPRQTVLLEKDEGLQVSAQFTASPAEVLTASKVEPLYADDVSSRWRVTAGRKGFFVWPVTYFPGWTAEVNNQPVRIYPAQGLFLSVFIPEAGIHTIEFQYTPYFFPLGAFNRDDD